MDGTGEKDGGQQNGLFILLKIKKESNQQKMFILLFYILQFLSQSFRCVLTRHVIWLLRSPVTTVHPIYTWFCLKKKCFKEIENMFTDVSSPIETSMHSWNKEILLSHHFILLFKYLLVLSLSAMKHLKTNGQARRIKLYIIRYQIFNNLFPRLIENNDFCMFSCFHIVLY